MINNENEVLCEITGNDKNVCMKLMLVDEAKTDMEYLCSSCNKSFCEVNPLFIGMVPTSTERKAV